MKIDTHLYYIGALVLSILFPFIFSFDKKVNFSQYFKVLVRSIPLVASFFIIGDVLYTYLGVWGFNESYHLEFTLASLPFEEILFFLLVPYACLFIYVAFGSYIKLQNGKFLDLTLAIAALIVAALALKFSSLLYTTVSLSFTAVLLFIIRYKRFAFNTQLLVAFLISIIPFILVNGFLTGSFTQEAIVWYNNSENLGLRILNIPIEDFSYSFNLLAWNIIAFEFFRAKI